MKTQQPDVREDYDGNDASRRHSRRDVEPVERVHAKSLATCPDRNRAPLTRVISPPRTHFWGARSFMIGSKQTGIVGIQPVKDDTERPRAMTTLIGRGCAHDSAHGLNLSQIADAIFGYNCNEN